MSGTYRSFRQRAFEGVLKDRFTPDYDFAASLLDDSYTFSEAHTSVAASLASHFVGASQTVNLPTEPLSFVALESIVGLAALFVDDAFGNFAPDGEDVTAVVIYDSDVPLLYLDDLTGLPGTTAGGEVAVEAATVVTFG